MQLRDKTNDELLALYDPEIILRLHNARSLKDTRRMLSLFRSFLGDRKPTAPLAKSFLAGYANRKPRTLYRYTQMIRPFMKWYGDPIEDVKIKVPKTLPPYTEDADIERLREAIRNRKSHKKLIPRDLLLIDLDLRTGLRRGGLSNLTAGDIHADFLITRNGKGQKDLFMPLVPSLIKPLHDFIKGMKPDEKVFKLGAASVTNKITIWAKKAGLKGFHTHSMRDKFGTDMIEAGANIKALQRLMGHESLATTEIYISSSDKSLRDAINLLDKTAGTPATERQTEPPLEPLVKGLQMFRMTLGGGEFSAAELIQKCWAKFEPGMSRNEFAEALTKIYPAANPGEEYFTVADALLAEFALLQIIRAEQRRIAGVRNQWDATYWVLTDEGRKLVRFLKEGNNPAT